MSEIIYATDYTDPGLQAIRDLAQSKNDNIPFLLLPVKIETRFMKVDRPLHQPDVYPDLVRQLFELEDRMHFTSESLPAHEVLGKLRKIRTQLEKIQNSTASINRISVTDKKHLIVKTGHLETAHRHLSQNLSRAHWSDAEKMREFRLQISGLALDVQQTTGKINQLSPTYETNYSETTIFLNTLENIREALQQIGLKNLSSKDRKENRSLFTYLEDHMGKIEESVRLARRDLNINMQATTLQLRKIKAFKRDVRVPVSAALKNISKIHSDYKRLEYQQRLTQVVKRVFALCDDLDKQLIPKIQLKQDLQIADARDVLWKINTLKFDLKQQNQRPFKTYEEIIRDRTKLYKELHALRADVYKVVEGTEEELDAISKAWDDTDNELEIFTRRVAAFKGTPKQIPGIKRTGTHINNEYRKDLAGLKTASRSYFSPLNNAALEKSAITLNTALDNLTAIQRALNENVNPASDTFKAALQKLIDFQATFDVAARDIHVLPAKTFSGLKSTVARLQSVIGKIPENTGGAPADPLLADARKAMLALETTVHAQHADSLNRKDNFYDEQRNPIVFAQKTITSDELWVRFYPDDIAIHTHEEALTATEYEAGKAYWYEIWAANDDYETKLAAWRAISTAFGSQRAAWIVKSLEPPLEEYQPLLHQFRLYSDPLIQVNSNLEKVSRILAQESGKNKSIEALGTAYPLLQQVDTQIKQIPDNYVNLLLKTQRVLLKIQSQLNDIIQGFNNGIRPDGPVDVLNQFRYTFNRIAKAFQQIKKKHSGEIIKRGIANDVFQKVKLRESTWTNASHSKVMPEKFVVATVRNGQFRHLVVGRPLPNEKLIVGLDPATFDTETFHYDADGNLIVDNNIKWLTDFKEATKIGMAVHITLSEEDVAEGFDKVFVLGLKDTTALDGKELLEQLLENHHYIPEGASFLPIATPTNNTDSDDSGYRTFETDAALSFAIERNNEMPVGAAVSPNFPTDAERLATGLGINPDVLNNLDYHNRTEVSEALVFNKALFHGTLGHYMEEGVDTLFTLDNIDRTKDFFCKYVTARGFLPALRVGTQPYGILPTTAFSKFHATSDDSFLPHLNRAAFEMPSLIQEELQIRYDIRLKELLNLLDGLWTEIRATKVPYSAKKNVVDAQVNFMDMLGLQANSMEHFFRYGLNVASRMSADESEGFSINFDSGDLWGPVNAASTFRGMVSSGYYYQSDNFIDEQNAFLNPLNYLNAKHSRISEQFVKSRVFSMRHLADQSKILGDIIDNRELAAVLVPVSNLNATDPAERLNARAALPYYIDWLVNSNAWDIHASNEFSHISEEGLQEAMPSKSLLFLLLRHAVLCAHSDTILKILEFEGLTDQVTRKKIGQPGYYNVYYFGHLTKWTYLFSKINKLDGLLGFFMNSSNAFYTYMNSKAGTSDGFLNRYLSPQHTYLFNQYANHAQHQPFVDALTETRDAVRKLKEIPTARLDQLLAEHIDLCTYRLDAWRLGLVNKRLENQRKANDTGVFLGAYGWVEDLRKGGERSLAQPIPAGLWKNGDAPVYTDADSLGFIHTPSLNHAVTAAILRAGFHANAAIAETGNPMAVNLSSGRVRMALNLLSGIRSGQDAAALLGYQFERGLHERYLHIPLELDAYIYDFRESFPLAVPVVANADLGDAVFTNVVNGMELLEAAQDFVEFMGGPPNSGASLYDSLQAHKTDWWAAFEHANIRNASDIIKDAFLKEIDRMADVFDALGDLCISESVYQVAKGNHVRASAIMDKLAKGDVPDEIEIADTPATGTVITHKAGLFFEPIRGIDHTLTATGTESVPLTGTALNAAVSAAGAIPVGWNSNFTPRALAEPTLNKWIGQMIGDPSKIKCVVDYTIEEDTYTMSVSLADLELQPLDVIYLFGTAAMEGGAMLDARMVLYVKSTMLIPLNFAGSPDDTIIRIKYMARNATWAADDYSFYEKAGYIQSLRSLLTDSGILAADALLIPGEEEVESNQIRNQDVPEFLIRIRNLQARFQLMLDEWNTFFTNQTSLANAASHTFTPGQIDSLRNLLVSSAAFGIPGTIPERMFGYDNAVGMDLLVAGDGAAKAISIRLQQATTDIQTAGDEAKSSNVRIDAIREAGKKLLGKAFVMLPHFTLRNAADLAAQIVLDPSKGLLRAAPVEAMGKWAGGLARVRERMAGLDTVQMWAENFDLVFPEKNPVQFPFALDETGVATDHWLGLEYPAGYQPTEDKLSLVLMNADLLSSGTDTFQAALLIDEWVEIIPNLVETTAITFNYDQPDAKPPNTLLLAVSPQETGQWQWDHLIYTLNDTLELAKNRAVEPEHLESTVFGQILPGILPEIVPPQFLPDDAENSDDAQGNPLGLQVVTDFGVVNDTYVPEPEI